MKSNSLLSEVLQFVRNWVDEMLTMDNATITVDTKIIEDLDLDEVMQRLLYIHLGIHFQVEFAEGDESVLNKERTVRDVAELLSNAGAQPRGKLNEQRIG